MQVYFGPIALLVRRIFKAALEIALSVEDAEGCEEITFYGRDLLSDLRRLHHEKLRPSSSSAPSGKVTGEGRLHIHPSFMPIFRLTIFRLPAAR